MEETEKLIDGLKDAFAEASEAEKDGDAARAGVLFEKAAELASRLGAKAADLLLGEEGESGEAMEGSDAVGPVDRMRADEQFPGVVAKNPAVLRWRSVEKEMRTFFYRNLPNMYETMREGFEKAVESGDREAQWRSFKNLGDLLVLMARLKTPTRGML